MQATNRTDTERSARKRWLTLLLVPAAALALGACANNTGMTQEDAAAIRTQINEVADRLDAVEQRLMEVSEQNDQEVLISDVRDVSNDVAEAKSMLDDVSAQLAETEPAADDGALDSPLNGDPLNDPLNDPLEDDGGALDGGDPLDSDPLDSDPLEDPLVPSGEEEQAPGL